VVNDQIANRDFKLKLISIRKAKAEEEAVKTYTQVQRSGFCDSAKVKELRQIGAEMVQDSKVTLQLDEGLQAAEREKRFLLHNHTDL